MNSSNTIGTFLTGIFAGLGMGIMVNTMWRQWHPIETKHRHISFEPNTSFDDDSDKPAAGSRKQHKDVLTNNKTPSTASDANLDLSSLSAGLDHHIQKTSVRGLDQAASLNDTVARSRQMAVARRLCFRRKGQVLGKGTILKLDQYETSFFDPALADSVILSGANNFREVKASGICGVGQPSQYGIQTVLNYLNRPRNSSSSEHTRFHAIWVNLREEPVIYINGRSFVLREFDFPKQNMSSYKGAHADHIEYMENQLKQEIIEESKRYNGNILIHFETESGEIKCFWEAIGDVEVQVITPAELFQTLSKDYHDKNKPVFDARLHYRRLPVNPEEPIQPEQIDQLLSVLVPGFGSPNPVDVSVHASHKFDMSDLDSHEIPLNGSDDYKPPFTHVIFNCQLGRGRSTTAMVATLLLYARLFSKGDVHVGFSLLHDLQEHLLISEKGSDQENMLSSAIPQKTKSSRSHLQIKSIAQAATMITASKRWLKEMRRKRAIKASLSLEDRAQRMRQEALYPPVVMISRLIASHQGDVSKLRLDSAIDLCGQLTNIRSSIGQMLDRYLEHPDATNILSYAANYLTRYVNLFLFDAYLWESAEQKNQQGFPFVSFSSWLESHPEFENSLELIKSKPDLALFVGTAHKSLPQELSSAETLEELPIHRSGVLLAAGMVLKRDISLKVSRGDKFLPELKAQDVMVQEDAFWRKMEGANIYNSSTCDRKGIHSIINNVQAIAAADREEMDLDSSPNIKANKQTSQKPITVLWFLMREDHMVYLDGKPFVLRDQRFPHFHHQQNHGLSGDRVDELENVLKDDIINESEKYRGRILLHGDVGGGILSSEWIEIGPQRQLKKHFPVEYTSRNKLTGSMETDQKDKRIVRSLSLSYGGLACEQHDIDLMEFVQTPQELFSDVVEWYENGERSGPNQRRFHHHHSKYRNVGFLSAEDLPPVDLKYVRVPVGIGRPLEPQHFDLIFDTIRAEEKANNGSLRNVHIVFQCLHGRARATVGCLIAALQRIASNKMVVFPDSRQTVRKFEYSMLLNLMRALPDGQFRRMQLDWAVDLCGETYHLRRVIDSMYNMEMRTREQVEMFGFRLKRRLARYCYLLVFNSFLHDYYGDAANHVSFAQWLQNHPEIDKLLSDIQSTTPEKLFKTWATLLWQDTQQQDLDNDGTVLDESTIVKRRNGNVLVQNSILKSDHFPGSHRKTIKPFLVGAPNFRKADSELPVYGVAIPTLEGIVVVCQTIFSDDQYNFNDEKCESRDSQPSRPRSLSRTQSFRVSRRNSMTMQSLPNSPSVPGNLALLEGSPLRTSSSSTNAGGFAVDVQSPPSRRDKGKLTKLLWINLREEPVVYVNGRPFVVRSVDNPFSNLEYTGIDPERVESMEQRLKEDILTEAEMFNGTLLLHDETPDGKSSNEWEEVNENTVLTPREAYQSLCQKAHFPIEYHRIAITDEQAPEVSDFDEIVNLVLPNIDQHIIFNCQMGRGRTTTGMVLCSLLHRWYRQQLGKDSIKTLEVSDSTSLPLDNELTRSNESEFQYRNGEYLVIMRLLRILKQGALAKLHCDSAIDSCYQMQNLRQDIFTYKEKLDIYSKQWQEASEAQRESIQAHYNSCHERGVNYLTRYFMLIAFSAYLMDQPTPAEIGFDSLPDEHKKFKLKFSQWMLHRRELYSLLHKIEF